MLLPSNRMPTTAGEILLEEFLKPAGVTQIMLANHTGWTPAKISEIINGKRAITPETALVLSDTFGTTAEFWLNLQLAVDLWQAKQQHIHVERLAS
jgi:addiction module HigA family antidote